MISASVGRVTYTGNGATVTFAVSYPFFEIEVYVDGDLRTEGTSSTQYAVTQANPGETGSIEFVTAPATSAAIVIASTASAVQEIDLENNQGFDAPSLELQLDRIVRVLNDHERDLSYAIRAPVTEDTVLPIDFKGNPNSVLVSDADGVPGLMEVAELLGLEGDAVITPSKPALAMLVIGQSNSVIQQARSWTPDPRVKLWNVDLQVEASVGTAYIDQPNTWINTAARFASEVATQEGRDVYIIPMGWGGVPIEKFVYGLQYDWDANTAVSDPGTGEIKGNNASLASVTKISASTYESDGVNSGFVTFAQLVPGHYWEIRKAGVLIAKYTVTAVTNHTTWYEIDVTYVSGSGSLSAADDVRVMGPPNMQLLMANNVAPALLEAGKTHADLVFLWQGEANAGAPGNWVDRAEELVTTIRDLDYIRDDTPIIASGISGTAQTGSAAFGQFSNHVQVFVSNDPARRCYFEPAVFPQELWDASAFWFHLTSDGIDQAGRLLYDIWAKGVGRKPSGLIYDPENGNIGLNGIPEADLSYRKDTNAPVIEHIANSHVGSSAAVLRRALTDAGSLDMIAQSLAAGGLGAIDWNGAARLLIRSQLSSIDFSAQASAATDFQIGSSGAQIPQGKKLNFADLSSNHVLSIQLLEELTANRLLTLVVGDAARTLTLSGNPTLADWFDQAVKIASSPTFAAVTLGNTGLKISDTNASHLLSIVPGSDLTANRILSLVTGDAARTLTIDGDGFVSAPGQEHATATNDDAAAGRVGEVVRASVAKASAVALTSNTPANVTSISLTAGHWRVRANVGFTGNVATVVNFIRGSISNTSATMDYTVERTANQVYFGLSPYAYDTTGIGANTVQFDSGDVTIKLTATTTIYLVANSIFATNTSAAFGTIEGERIR